MSGTFSGSVTVQLSGANVSLSQKNLLNFKRKDQGPCRTTQRHRLRICGLCLTFSVLLHFLSSVLHFLSIAHCKTVGTLVVVFT
jgi:hypothetical protein